MTPPTPPTTPTIKTKGELLREFQKRAKAAGLTVDVPSDGIFNARVAVVAEAPGEREKIMRTPLVGGSGQLLWRHMKSHNMTRQHVYISNVIKKQVSLSTKGNARAPVSQTELVAWEELLRWELAQLPHLQIIFIMGKFALRALTGETGITNWRGSVIDIELNGRPIRCVVANNPAFVMREPRLEVMFRLDVLKLHRVIEGKYKEYKIDAHINPSPREAMDHMDKMQDEDKPVAYDIETLGGETACVGLANDPHEGMCINFRDLTNHTFSAVEEQKIRLRMQRLLAADGVALVAQNGNFDCYWQWYKDRIQVRRVWFDTLLAHHLLYPRLPHSLAFLTAQYTDHPFYKDEGKKWKEGGDIDQFWRYNVTDCCITLAAQQHLHRELRAQKLEDFFFSHVMRLQPHLVEMTVGGVKADTGMKNKITLDLAEEVELLKHRFHEAVHVATGDYDYNPNPLSPTQLRALFFKRLALVGRGISTDAANRARILDHPNTPDDAKEVIKTLSEYKTEHKFYSTYADSTIDEDGRFRCENKQYGTQSAPGRLSTSQTLWGSGTNLQNQPERARGMFIADEGYGLAYFDLEQAEARVVGWKAGIDTWKEQFERARLNPGTYDCHRALAADMWHMPYDDVPTKDFIEDEHGIPHHTIRYIAKRCRHGLNYRMGPDKLAEVTGLSMAEAAQIWNIYHRTSPEVRQWWSATEREVIQNKVLYNAFGRRLIILEKVTPEAMESIIAYYPQSTIGDKVCQVIYQSHDDDDWPEHARIRLNVHDALIALAPLAKVKTCLRIMKKYAEQPIMIDGEPLIIPAECKEATPDEQGIRRWSNLQTVEIAA